MKPRVLALGAGFGGLELATVLSERLGDSIDVTLIDKADAFVFGYSKLDMMFGRTTPDAIRLRYSELAKPGVRFVQETITAIDPETKTVTTDGGTYETDELVIALGADYDYDATPGLAEANEFYSPEGAEHLRDALPAFTKGRAIVGVCGAPFKCPPAPSECALMLHDYLVERGVRDDCEIVLVMPFTKPIPPSPDASDALLEAFDEREIAFVAQRKVASLDGDRRVAVLDDGSELEYEMFFGVPVHRAPRVVRDSGLADGDWVPADTSTLQTRYAGVYAVGDVATLGIPKAGMFAEGEARALAHAIAARIEGAEPPRPYDGTASCYIEFGAGRVGRVDVDFLSAARPMGAYHRASTALVADKQEFGASRRARWFGLR